MTIYWYDYLKVHEVITLAFGEDNGSKIVDKIGSGKNFIPELSLVAEVDGEVVWHILFSRISINCNQTYESLVLALYPYCLNINTKE